jgi:aminomethyltransferase
MLRTESYLLFYPGDNSETYPFEDGSPCGDTLWELGLDFTVSPGKIGFVGAENHYALKGKERFKIYGVRLEGTTVADEGAALLRDGKQVGHVTYGLYSELNNHNVGIARMPVDAAVPGTKLTVRNADGTEIPAVAEEMPFYDKEKKVRTAKG